MLRIVALAAGVLGGFDFGGLTLGSRYVSELLVHLLAPKRLMMGTSGSEPINGDLLAAVENTFLDNRACIRHGGQSILQDLTDGED